MCIAYISVNQPEWPLFIAANRDEFHNRPSKIAAPWPNNQNIIAGIDLVAGGTWLGITRQGRFALLTNFRDPVNNIKNAPTRGALVSDFLKNSISPEKYMDYLQPQMQNYNGFNLIVGEAFSQKCRTLYISNKQDPSGAQTLETGSHVISNHLLNTRWPKSMRLKKAFDEYNMNNLHSSLQHAFTILKDTNTASDNELPSTGVGIQMERLLSSPFIISPEYGTRCSTIIAVHNSGKVFFSEASYDSDGILTQRHDWPFMLEGITSRPGM